MIKYSLVIPFFNEEKNIKQVLLHLSQVDKKIKDIEFILINNGSTDNSKEVFKKNLKNLNKKTYKLFIIKKNLGYGHGIKYGLNKSKGSFLSWTHSDLQTNPQDIIKAIKLLKKNKNKNEILIKGTRTKRESGSTFQTKAMEFISSIFLGIIIKDINAQPNLISKKFYYKYLKDLAPDDLSFDLYCYALAAYKKIDILKFKVLFKKRLYGDVKGGGEGGSIFAKIKLIIVTIKCLLSLRFKTFS
tara:strand:- start:317 stop:1048 length:732 start_codon:yes stop_codon:yes gene_type:complete